MMKNFLPIVLIVTALLGLGVVQFQWLKSGVVVEKQVFDREVRRLLRGIASEIEQHPRLMANMLRLQQYRKSGQPAPDSLKLVVLTGLDTLVRPELRASSKNMPFSLALTESIWRYPLASSTRFDWADAQAYRSYSAPIKGRLAEACQCQLFLHLQLRDFLPELLSRLGWLLSWTAAGLLLLLTGFVLLIRKVRREQKLIAIKNDFINNLTHELKTPVFSSSLLLRLLEQSLEAGAQGKSQRYLERLRQDNERLKSQIEQVLELASLEHPAYQLERTLFPVGPWVEGLGDAFRAKIEERGGQLDVQMDAGIQLRADRGHLESALLNLLDNAMKYGGVPPRVLLRVRQEGEGLLFEVADNGNGVPPEYQEKVFQKFYRMGDSKVAGFGLGLSYVQQVARLHRGKAGVRNTAQGGALFWIRLPGALPRVLAGPTQKLTHG